MNAEIRPQALHRPSDPGLQVFGMETMQEQDRPHLLVFREPRQGTVVCTRDNSHEPRQRDPVQVKDKLYQFARGCPGSRISELTESLNQLLDPSQCCIKTAFVVHVSDRPTPNIGECTVSSVLPLPRYMWTPQGRHGSKLLTVRMISMPLNLSGPFSSKIGVPCTASS